MLKDARVWALAIPDFGIVLSTYGVGLWLPQIVKGLGFSNLGTGFGVAAVYVAASIVSVLWCLSSDPVNACATWQRPRCSAPADCSSQRSRRAA
jgi:hypothetical protein